MVWKVSTNPKDLPLSFNEFKAPWSEGYFSPHYNNFPTYWFPPSPLGSIYHDANHYVKFKGENMDLDRKIQLFFEEHDITSLSRKLIPVEPLLFDAYKIMRNYEGVSDFTLFS